MVQIALVSCGTEYSGIQKEIEKAALKFGAEIILPEIDLDYINEAYEKFGFSAQSSSLKLSIHCYLFQMCRRCIGQKRSKTFHSKQYTYSSSNLFLY